jgi:hypothetical protein
MNANDFLSIHNDDLTPIRTYEGVTIYSIDYDRAEQRGRDFIKKLIQIRKESENEKDKKSE